MLRLTYEMLHDTLASGQIGVDRATSREMLMGVENKETPFSQFRVEKPVQLGVKLDPKARGGMECSTTL